MKAGMRYDVEVLKGDLVLIERHASVLLKMYANRRFHCKEHRPMRNNTNRQVRRILIGPRTYQFWDWMLLSNRSKMSTIWYIRQSLLWGIAWNL